MSNREQDSSDSRWEGVRFDSDLLVAALADQTAAVDDAEGDVRAARERQREDVRTAQERFRQEIEAARGPVRNAEEALARRQQAIREELIEMDLVGRMIIFTSGISLTDNTGEDQPTAYELTGTTGTIKAFEVGSLHGTPIEPADTIIFHIDTSGSSHLPADAIAVDAFKTGYTTGAFPQAEA